MKFDSFVVLVLALAGLTGCRTVQSDSLVTFSASVHAVRSQSTEAFAAVNDLMADTSLDYVVKQPRLMESDFAAGLDLESLEAWDQILSKIEKYALDLQALTSPELASQFGDSMVDLSAEFKQFGAHLQGAGLVAKSPSISPGIAAGFTELGELLVKARAQHQARKVVLETDPEIAHIFTGMADSVGDSATNGVRGTVRAHWEQRLAELKVSFLSASDGGAKRQIASDFRDVLKRRDAQELVLVSLRRSLLQLKYLHQALGRGDQRTAQSIASSIGDEIKQFQELTSRFQQVSTK